MGDDFTTPEPWTDEDLEILAGKGEPTPMATATCETCGEEVDPNAVGVFRLVKGWVQNRSDGGAHAVSRPEELHEYRHQGCHKHGLQTSLL